MHKETNNIHEIRLSKREIQRRLNSIRIRPKGLGKRHYGVSVKYFSDDLSSRTNVLIMK